MQIDVLDAAPVWMQPSERLLLYALVYGLRPRCVLEIGSLYGGSALIMSAAMDAVLREDPDYQGKLVAVDPDFKIEPAHRAVLASRTTFVPGRSPDVLAEARSRAGQPFDLVLIDAMHEADFVAQDIDGVLPFLDRDGYLLFHDAHCAGVRQAIDKALKRYPLVDCGMLAVDDSQRRTAPDGTDLIFCGLRLLHRVPTGRYRSMVFTARRHLRRAASRIARRGRALAKSALARGEPA